MLVCGAIPVAKSAGIEDIKEAAAETQAQLIETCERHDELVQWWERTNKAAP